MSEFISPTDSHYDERSRSLVSIGKQAIAVENEAALRAYFSEDFAFHGPDGDLTFDELKAFFAAMRRAFRNFACERRELVSQGNFIAARTTMSGIFDNTFDASPLGPIQPNGVSMKLELINFFRYDAGGLLAEEWVQYDNMGFLKQLRAELKSATGS